MSNPSKFIFKFSNSVPLSDEFKQKLTGTVNARQLVPLFSIRDILKPNPRLPKVHNVTESIMESISKTPSSFQFKSKGILLGASQYRELDRGRIEISFIDSSIEGLQDGGHNLLSLGMHILENEIDFENTLPKIRYWEEFQTFWFDNLDHIKQRISENLLKDDSTLNFEFPLEVLLPLESLSEADEKEYLNSLLEICAARNNNSELTRETVNNRQGIYDYHKQVFGEFANEIEWRTNDGGRIKVRDIVALNWIPLMKLELPIKHGVNPVKTYASKGECSKQFGMLMRHESISTAETGSVFELKDDLVRSSVEITKDLIDLYDLIYELFPNAYNKCGSFGRIKPVKWYDTEDKENPKTTSRQPTTFYRQKNVRYSYPPAFIIPIVCGLGALLNVGKKEITWKADPKKFLEDNLDQIVAIYKDMMSMANYEPNSIGKSPAIYSLVEREFENILTRMP